jgi:glyoxylase-like metal-dependent hydrolase (beta-lactamase superfamily II)
MIEVNSFGDVVQIRMGRDAPEGVSWGAGQEVLYWTAAYLVDGLLIDTGCRHTGEELVSSLDGRNVNLAVNTHYHEDHIGGNTIVRSRFGVEVLASRETIEIMQDYPPLKPY